MDQKVNGSPNNKNSSNNEEWKEKWDESLTYVPIEVAIKYLSAHGFASQTKPTLYKLDEKYALPYQDIQSGKERAKRHYYKEGLEDFVRNPQKYLILNKEGLYSYLTDHGFPCKNDEQFEELKKYYVIPYILRDPNKPEDKMYTIKELEKFVENPKKYAVKRNDIVLP